MPFNGRDRPLVDARRGARAQARASWGREHLLPCPGRRAHLQRGRRRCTASSRRSSATRPGSSCSSSTTPRPTAPARWPTGWPRRGPGCTCCTARARTASATPIAPASPGRSSTATPRSRQLDADLSHPPALLPRMLEALERGADLVLGSRYAPGGGSDGWPLHRRARQPPRLRRSRRARSACPTPISPAGSSSGAPPRSPPSTSRPRARRATSSRSRRRSARIAPGCASSSCRSRSAIAPRASRRCAPSIAFEGVRMVARLRRDGWKPQRVASAARTGA